MVARLAAFLEQAIVEQGWPDAEGPRGGGRTNSMKRPWREERPQALMMLPTPPFDKRQESRYIVGQVQEQRVPTRYSSPPTHEPAQSRGPRNISKEAAVAKRHKQTDRDNSNQSGHAGNSAAFNRRAAVRCRFFAGNSDGTGAQPTGSREAAPPGAEANEHGGPAESMKPAAPAWPRASRTVRHPDGIALSTDRDGRRCACCAAISISKCKSNLTKKPNETGGSSYTPTVGSGAVWKKVWTKQLDPDRPLAHPRRRRENSYRKSVTRFASERGLSPTLENGPVANPDSIRLRRLSEGDAM